MNVLMSNMVANKGVVQNNPGCTVKRLEVYMKMGGVMYHIKVRDLSPLKVAFPNVIPYH